MKSKATTTFAFILVGLFLLGVTRVPAQTRAQLRGRISDSSGGAFENLHIIVEDSSRRFEAITNVNGEYDLLLPPGVYNVSSSKIRGFVPYSRKKLRIKPGKVKILNIKLKVASEDVISVLYDSRFLNEVAQTR